MIMVIIAIIKIIKVTIINKNIYIKINYIY